MVVAVVKQSDVSLLGWDEVGVKSCHVMNSILHSRGYGERTWKVQVCGRGRVPLYYVQSSSRIGTVRGELTERIRLRSYVTMESLRRAFWKDFSCFRAMEPSADLLSRQLKWATALLQYGVQISWRIDR